MFKKILTLFIFCLTSSLSAHLNLEENLSPFVLKTKKIEIPGYPHAFNPSMIKIGNRFLLSFRIIPKILSKTFIFQSAAESRVGLVWLDKNFNPKGNVHFLSLNENCNFPSRSEDARLLKVQDKIYLVFSDNQEEVINEGGFRMYVAELKINETSFSLLNQQAVLSFEGENFKRREKNWVPFDYQGNLLLAYSLNPHRIVYPIPLTHYAETIATSKSLIDWKLGELRGGTPALLDEDEYLGFFHSSKEMVTCHSNGKKILHYFMGAYTFNNEPPFEIQKISKDPITCEGFYNGPIYEPYWKPVRVVFPCGLCVDKHYVYVSYGRQDHEIWVMKIDKQGLKNSLIPINQD